EAIEKRFRGNKETKKVQKTLLKQQYENFRRHQLEILEKSAIRVENSHFDLEEQSLDDLFNNLKIYEAEVKGSSTSRQTTQNIACVSSNNIYSSNESVNTVPSVSTASSKATVSTLLNVDSLSDDVIYSFFASQSNSPQLENEDLKQIDADYLEEMDLKECRSQRDKRNKEAPRRTVPVEADEEPTNYALMAYASSGSSSSLGSDNEFDVLSYKTGLESVEARLVVYQHNEIVFKDDIILLKLDFMLRDNALVELRKKLEKDEKERDDLKLTLEKIQTSFKNLKLPSYESDDSVSKSPETDSESVTTVLNVESSTNQPSKDMSKTLRPDAPIIKDWTSNSKDEIKIESVHKQKESSFVQTSEHVKTPRVSVKTIEHPKQAKNLRTDTQKSRGHKNSWNRKVCFVCKSLSHLIKDCDYYEKQMVQMPVWNYAMRVNHHNCARMTHPHSNMNVVPTTVLTRSRLVPLNTAKPISTAVPHTIVKSPRPVKHVVNKSHSPIRRPINHRPATKNSNFNHKVTTVKVNKGIPQQALKDKGVSDSGCSRHMTGNIYFLLDFEAFNGGYVAFGGNPKGGKILGKGKIKTGKLDFDDVYFVKELKFNLFSVSQMCDKKNIVLFTYTECVVLSSDYKLPDENHVLLRVPRENNMYNVDLKNVVPLGDLTCLFAKATLDESTLWHRRLGHINFKTMNKLVKGNLVRGLPSKIFENNHTCVACKKGKQHRASYKSKPVSSVSHPLQRLHMDLFRSTFVKSLNKKSYCLVVTDDYRSGPKWRFDIDTLTQYKNCQPVVIGNQLNHNAGIKENLDACEVEKETNENEVHVSPSGSNKTKKHDDKAKRDDKGKSPIGSPTGVQDLRTEFEEFSSNSTNRVNAASAPINAARPNPTNNNNGFNTASPSDIAVSPNFRIAIKSLFLDPSNYPNDPVMPALEHIIYSDYEEDVGTKADLSNLETNITVSSIPTSRVYKDHPVTQIIGDLTLAPQTRSMERMVKEQGGLNQVNDEDFHICMFACFLSREEPKNVHQALKDPSWIEAKHEELLQLKMQKVWVLVDLPKGKRAIGSKWVFRNKKDKRGIVIKNKARLVAQGHTQEEGIDYDEVFAPVARIKAIQLFLAYASFIGFMVYQMDVKCAFLYGTIEEEVHVCQPLGFEDPDYPDKVYKVVKALYGLHQAPRAWYEILANYLLENGFQRGKIDQTLFIKKQKGDILLVQVYVDDIIYGSTNKELCKAFEKLMKDNQDKYVAKILRKFSLTDVKSASTPIETEKPLLKDPDVKRIFRYLKGKLHLGLWYPKDSPSPFNLVAYSDSDYDGASLDRKSTTGGCQFLGCRLISWQCKKQTVVATSSTEAEYVVAASCCAQVLWIQNHFITAVSYKLTLFGLMEDVAVKLMRLAPIDEKKVGITEEVIRQYLHLDDVDGVECLPNEEIFVELACMGYEKPPPNVKRTAWNEFSCSMASAVICLATGRNFNFSKYIFDSMVRNVDSPSKFLMYPRFLQVIINAQVADVSSLTTRYTSPSLTQKVFANMRRVRKVEEDDVEVPTAPTPPSLTTAPLPPPQDPIPTPLQAQPATPSSPTQEQPTTTFESNMSLLNTLMETWRKIEATDADEDITLVDVETQEETLIKMKAEKAKLLDEQMAKMMHDEEYDDKWENINWNAVAEQIQEKHLDNIRKYQSLKRKPVFIAQARKNMIIYLKNMVGYKMEHFRDVEEPQKKRVAEETLLQESFKKLKAVEVSGSKSTQDTPTNDPKEMSKEDVQNMLEIVPISEFKVKALQVELKRLFKPDADHVPWKIQRYMHYPITWKLYSNCGVHQLSSTTRRYDMFMLTEKNYPLSNRVMTLMLSAKFQVEEDSDMAIDLVMKIFIEANKPKSRSLDTSSK
nr:hypothetical protein [Tanacetum cinerariifolium]